MKKEDRQQQLLKMLLSQRLTNLKHAATILRCSRRSVQRDLNELRKKGFNSYYSPLYQKFMLKNMHEGQHDKGDAENLE
jgi:predicted DNA-binding transcriptional regulator YafY